MWWHVPTLWHFFKSDVSARWTISISIASVLAEKIEDAELQISYLCLRSSSTDSFWIYIAKMSKKLKRAYLKIRMRSSTKNWPQKHPNLSVLGIYKSCSVCLKSTDLNVVCYNRHVSKVKSSINFIHHVQWCWFVVMKGKHLHEHKTRPHYQFL